MEMQLPHKAHIAEQFFASRQGFHATESPVSPFYFGWGGYSAFTDCAIDFGHWRGSELTEKQAAQPVPLSAIHGHDAHFGVGSGIAGDVLGENFKVKSRKIVPIEKERTDGRDVGLPLGIHRCKGNV